MRVHHLTLASVLLVPTVLGAQQRAETGFLWMLGNDTTQIERVTREGTRLHGIHLSRVPETTIREWSAELAPDGTVRRFDQTLRRGGGEVLSRRTMVFTGDSVINTFIRGDSASARRLAAPVLSLPDLPNSYGLIELAMQRLGAGDSLAFWLLSLGGQPAEPAALIRVSGETVTLRLEGLPPISLRVDGTGRVVSANNLGTTVTRVPPPDMTALAAAFTTRSLGELSPRDTARAEIGGAKVFVDYGRPARRGRVVLGGLVPWNEVWRTGANRTTTLVTDAELQIGDARIAPGSYALFTIPAPGGWTLIINRNVGSGLAYDQAQDVARVPLPTTRLAQPVERFTIGLEPRGSEALLSFTWENVRAAVPVRRR